MNYRDLSRKKETRPNADTFRAKAFFTRASHAKILNDTRDRVELPNTKANTADEASVEFSRERCQRNIK